MNPPMDDTLLFYIWWTVFSKQLSEIWDIEISIKTNQVPMPGAYITCFKKIATEVKESLWGICLSQTIVSSRH